jgi:Glycosyltransferase family 87
VNVAVAAALGIALGATGLLVAAVTVRGPVVSFLLAAWLAVVAEAQLVALALSPIHAVGRPGYAACEALALVVAFLVWRRAGSPRPERPDLGWVRREPILIALTVGVGLAFVYEAFLCLTVAPNNWDSLTYHLPRAAWWYQHQGIEWIPDAPTERQNAFPAGSELTDLWSFVALHSDGLAACVQLIAGATAAIGIFGIARRLGWSRPASAFASLVFPTLALVALESTTTQNDLLATSLVVASLYFLLGRGAEAPLSGPALALAVGVKLTAALAAPGFVLLAVVQRASPRRALAAVVGFVVTFAVLDAWLYVENVIHTGRLLGHGSGRVEHSPDLTVGGWLASVVRILYRFLDLTGVPRLGLGMLGSSILVLLTLAVVLGTRRLGIGTRPIASTVTAGAALVALPSLVTILAAACEKVVRGLHLKIDPAGTSEGAFSWAVSHRVHEDFSYFGPLGLVLVVLVAGSLRLRVTRSAPAVTALAASFVLFLAGMAATYRFNDFVGRFMIVPVALAAPLFADVYRHAAAAAGIAVLGLIVLALTLAGNELKPAKDRPWSLSRTATLDRQVWQAGIGNGVTALEETTPSSGCIGALLGGDDAAYPLFGPHLSRRIAYVVDLQSAPGALILGPSESSVTLDREWRVKSLGGYWRLGLREGAAVAFSCSPHSE